jgi:hypothetical protein
VLNTIPKVFDIHENAMIMVTGSDIKPEFIEKCKVSCSRECGEKICKKAHRRINIYRGFVDKNFDQLNKDYIFYGGERIENQNIVELYSKGQKYNAVFFTRFLS